MNSNNLIFSSNIDAQLEDETFDILYNYLKDADYDNVYVENIMLAPNEILFFAKVDSKQTIIRVPIEID